MIQLREKHLSPAEFLDDAGAALAFAREHSVKVIINDRVDIAHALKADGVHLGQDDLPAAAARTILGKNAIIGFSTHTFEQVRKGLQLPVDYIAFGPVFDTQSKDNPDDTVGLPALTRTKEIIGNKTLVAIGGIDINNCRTVLVAGADSAAIISSILSNAEQIESRMKAFNSI